jgi:hypothetical protein
VAGFLPVGSFPVASVPAGSGGVLNDFSPATASIVIDAHAGTFEHTNLKVRVSSFTAEALVENDPAMRVYSFTSEALVENDPPLRVSSFCVEVLRTVAVRRRPLSVSDGRGD